MRLCSLGVCDLLTSNVVVVRLKSWIKQKYAVETLSCQTESSQPATIILMHTQIGHVLVTLLLVCLLFPWLQYSY